MTTRNYSSRSQQSTLTSAVTAGATTIVVQSGPALLGGATIAGGTTFTLVVDPDTAIEEIVDATAVSTNTFTITRAIDGSSAQAHSAGAVVRHMAIGRDYREANVHIESTTGVHGATGAVVGTTDTQTLTNKTLTAPIITNPSITGAGVDASIVFEGATADAHETTLTVEEPTQDNVITLPNTTGTVVIANAAQTLTNKTMGDALNAGGFKITNLATPTLASDAVRKDFADAQVAAAATSAASAAVSATAAATSATSAAASASAASTSASSALTSANSAATSASTMAASVAAAAASATAAATSATSAAASATTAANSATAAATSATSAAASATAAATSATSAAASATTAANSVATIAGYASSAATSEANAAASATAAATSAASAAASTSAAAASATAAATSATSAAASATAAATSATSAAASATAAATSATSAAASAASAAAVLDQAFDAKGDLLVGTGADTFDQLPLGTNGYLLTADSATATGIKWAAAPVSLPDQTGNAGEYLTTDGTTASWAVVATPVAQTTEPASPTDGLIWVDTDGTALINQLLRWSKAPAGGTTTLSGNDDNSVPLTYSVGYEQVFQNGALLARGSDYTATNGTTISLTNASVTGDIFEVFAAQPVAISDVYTQTQANAAFINDSLLTTTGDIIYASGANTPARLGVGSTGQVLSVSGGVPAWATPASGSTYSGSSAYRSSSQTLTANAYTAIQWNAEYWDTNTYHDNSTNPSRFTIPSGKAGYYSFRFNVGIGSVSGDVYFHVRVNGTTKWNFSWDMNMPTNVQGSVTLNMAVGDYVELFIYHTTAIVTANNDEALCSFDYLGA